LYKAGYAIYIEHPRIFGKMEMYFSISVLSARKGIYNAVSMGKRVGV
jgi:hypothetical protein